jgi:hypothetical protein
MFHCLPNGYQIVQQKSAPAIGVLTSAFRPTKPLTLNEQMPLWPLSDAIQTIDWLFAYAQIQISQGSAPQSNQEQLRLCRGRSA